MRACTLSLITLLLLVPGAFAQETLEIRPGHPALDTTPVRSATDSLAVYIVDDGEVIPVGRLVRETVVEGDRILRTEEFFGRMGQRVWFDEFEVEDHTLRPISSRSEGMVEGDFRFNDGAVVAIRDGQEVERRLEQPVFVVKSLDAVIASLPLDEGYSAVLFTLDEETLEERALPLSVTRAVAVQQAEGEARETWEVHLDLDGAVDVYHVDRTTGELVRYESALEGVVMLRWGGS